LILRREPAFTCGKEVDVRAERRYKGAMPHLQVFLPDSSQVTHELDEERTSIGRVEGNSLRIDDPSVSSQHAEIISDGTLFHLHDQGSTNGTFLNGEQVTDAVLNNGDEIRFGMVQAVFVGQQGPDADAQPLPETSAVATVLAAQSARPDNFKSTSPIPHNVAKTDPLALVCFAAAGIALLVSAAAAAMAFLMTA
jgi:pSer/pThr/pTyr-binding forkhead associated (FHA) protein